MIFKFVYIDFFMCYNPFEKRRRYRKRRSVQILFKLENDFIAWKV